MNKYGEMIDSDIDAYIAQARADGKLIGLHSSGRVTIDGIPLANSKLITVWCKHCQRYFQSYIDFKCSICGFFQ